MNFSKLLDEFYEYLIGINFGSAKPYRDWLEKIYNDYSINNNYLKDSIKDTTVGLGGSITLKELGIFDILQENISSLHRFLNILQ